MSTLQKLSQDEQAVWATRVNELADGKVKPKHVATPHSISKLKEARNEFSGIQRNIQQAEAQLRALNERRLRIEGICEQCIDDIVHWESIAPDDAKGGPAPGLPKGRNGKASSPDVKAASAN